MNSISPPLTVGEGGGRPAVRQTLDALTAGLWPRSRAVGGAVRWAGPCGGRGRAVGGPGTAFQSKSPAGSGWVTSCWSHTVML